MKPVRIEGSRKLSSYVEPMKAQLSDRPAFDSPDWLFEIKWDGYRAIAEIRPDGNRLYSRNGLTFDKAYQKVFESLKAIKKRAIIDGEIVAFDSDGRPSFQKLQNYRNTSNVPIQYYVFDLLELDGKPLTGLPLVERKKKLRKLIPESSILRYCDHVENDGKVFFQEMQKLNLEGMIAKKKDSRYQVGKRSPDWLKIKNIHTQEAIIVGYTDPKGSRQYFGSLLLAVHDNGDLVSIGNVGTGFTTRTLAEIYKKLVPLKRKKSPLDVPIKETPDITWVAPVLVCNVKYSEITEDGVVRHPVFQGLRVDKSPEEVTREK